MPKEAQENQETEDSLPYDYVEQDPEYMDYLAELATKEMEQEYLSDEEEYEKMLKLCEEIATHHTSTIALGTKKEIDGTSEVFEAEFFGEDYTDYDSNPEYHKYLNMLHDETLSKILCHINEIDFEEEFKCKLRDDLFKYRDAQNMLHLEKIPNKIYAVLILLKIFEAANHNSFGFMSENLKAYVYTRKYWKNVSYDTMKHFFSLVAVKLGFYSNTEALGNNFTKELMKQFLAQTPIIPPSNDKQVLINLQNGTYEIVSSKFKLREHSKTDYLKYILPYEYQPSAQAPQFMTYLQQVLPDKESQAVLQEFHGYIFTKGLKLEKTLLLYGMGANGKSVQFDVTRELIGKNNVSTKSLGDLVNRDSGSDNIVKLQDKLLNFGSEISAAEIRNDTFKKLVSGEPVSGREKYQTSVDIENGCKFIFNANQLPDTKDHTEAFYRRFLVLSYNIEIAEDERDPELSTKLISELPGIFNWVLEGLERLLSQKTFSQCQASLHAIEEYRIESNDVSLFLRDKHIETDTSDRMSIASLFIMYEAWVKENRAQCLTKSKFSRELKLLKFKSYQTAKERGYYAKVNVPK